MPAFAAGYRAVWHIFTKIPSLGFCHTALVVVYCQSTIFCAISGPAFGSLK